MNDTTVIVTICRYVWMDCFMCLYVALLHIIVYLICVIATVNPVSCIDICWSYVNKLFEESMF
jgi:hypothetical protein